jgi:hypothetical protein
MAAQRRRNMKALENPVLRLLILSGLAGALVTPIGAHNIAIELVSRTSCGKTTAARFVRAVSGETDTLSASSSIRGAEWQIRAAQHLTHVLDDACDSDRVWEMLLTSALTGSLRSRSRIEGTEGVVDPISFVAVVFGERPLIDLQHPLHDSRPRQYALIQKQPWGLISPDHAEEIKRDLQALDRLALVGPEATKWMISTASGRALVKSEYERLLRDFDDAVLALLGATALLLSHSGALAVRVPIDDDDEIMCLLGH